MKNVSTLIGAVSLLVILLFRFFAKLYNNRGRADAVRNGIANGADRAKDIASGINDAKRDNDEAGDAIGRASESVRRADKAVGNALDLIRAIRKRRQVDPDSADGGDGSD